mmetsp:Transcript_63644/g.109308  ORF Transcript_63644/g.109308 Transcript_63644/m.109308 type:complete len:714 (+) Transcript_63644:24-2165(+)
MKGLLRIIIFASLVVLYHSEDIADKAGIAFGEAQAWHAKALQTSMSSHFRRAIKSYRTVLTLMRDNHPATQFYLGTCQLDWGANIDDGVSNIEAALKADPENFDGSATRRLIEGRSVAAMQARKMQGTRAVDQSNSSGRIGDDDTTTTTTTTVDASSRGGGGEDNESAEATGNQSSDLPPVFRGLGPLSPLLDADNADHDHDHGNHPDHPVLVWDNALSGENLDTFAESAAAVFDHMKKKQLDDDDDAGSSVPASTSVWFDVSSAAAVPAAKAKAAQPSAPRTAIEELIRSHLVHLVPGLKAAKSSSESLSSEPSQLDEWVGCEYWVRRQPAGRGVATHYDTDVARKRLSPSQARALLVTAGNEANAGDGLLVTPHRSSILYLSGGKGGRRGVREGSERGKLIGAATPDNKESGSACSSDSSGSSSSSGSSGGSSDSSGNRGISGFGAGPTVVLEQRMSPSTSTSNGGVGHFPSVPRAAHFVWPKRARFVVFDGSLHHGVMPAERRGEEAEKNTDTNAGLDNEDDNEDDDDDDEVRTTVLINWWTVRTGRPLPPNCAPLPLHSSPALLYTRLGQEKSRDEGQAGQGKEKGADEGNGGGERDGGKVFVCGAGAGGGGSGERKVRPRVVHATTVTEPLALAAGAMTAVDADNAVAAAAAPLAWLAVLTHTSMLGLQHLPRPLPVPPPTLAVSRAAISSASKALELGHLRVEWRSK